MVGLSPRVELRWADVVTSLSLNGWLVVWLLVVILRMDGLILTLHVQCVV